MSDQEKLDAATRRLRKTIRTLDALAEMADAEADALCQPDQCAASADLRDLAADLRASAAKATAAYAKGRRLRVPASGGVITPFFGGDGK